MCLYVDEPSWCLRESTPKARKEHQCGECRRTIEPGEKYRQWVCLDDGYFMVYKMCAHCYAVMEVGVALTGCPFNWFWGEVMNHHDVDMGFVANIIHDVGHDLPAGSHARMLRYVALARRGWRDRSGELAPIPEAA